jgi:hypothetical protein
MKILDAIWARIQSEPVATYALVQAAVGLGVAFGLHVSGPQTAEIMTATAAFLGWATRQSVTPNLPVTR